VSDLTLTAKSPLSGFTKHQESVSVSEMTGKALVSVAIPNGGEKKLATAITKCWKTDLPQTGMSTLSSDGSVRLLGMQIDQLFVVFDFDGDDAVAHVADRLGTAGYFTNQSDSWVMVAVSGPESRTALARICSLDLDQNVFVKGAVARTVMEHLGVIIFHSEPDKFIILSARSSAQSLLHAINTSVTNIL